MSDKKHHTKSEAKEDNNGESEERVVVQIPDKDGAIKLEKEYKQAEVAPDKPLPIGPQGNRRTPDGSAICKSAEARKKKRLERIAASTEAKQESETKKEHRRMFLEINFPDNSMHQEEQEEKKERKHHTAKRIERCIRILREGKLSVEDRHDGYSIKDNYSLKEESDEKGVVTTKLMRSSLSKKKKSGWLFPMRKFSTGLTVPMRG